MEYSGRQCCGSGSSYCSGNGVPKKERYKKFHAMNSCLSSVDCWRLCLKF